MYREISDKELEQKCKNSINIGTSRGHFYDEMQSLGFYVGQERLKTMWMKCGGQLYPYYNGAV